MSDISRENAILTRVKRVRDGYVEFLGKYKWEWYYGANFNGILMGMEPRQAIKYHKEYFIKKLYRKGKPLSYFAVVEKFKLGGVHIHGLLAGVDEDYRYGEVIEIWRGINKVDGEPSGYFYTEKYNPEKGAAGYVAKYISKEMCEWDFSLKNEHKLDYVDPQGKLSFK